MTTRALGWLLLGMSAAAVAQDQPAEPEAEAVQLGDIVVSATKREQSTREIAGSVSALDGEDLERIGARELKDFAALVPGFTVQEGVADSFRKFTIRGIGPGDRVNQTVGQLIGDVPMADPFPAVVVPDLDPFDLRTIEILKGPQGTVFGASGLNGAIRYVPNVPELGAWNGRAFADVMSVNEGGRAATFGAVLNAPIGEEFALRLAGLVQKIPGVYDNNARGIEDADRGDKWTGRLMARWQATDRLGVNALCLRQQSRRNDQGVADNREGRLENSDHPGPSTFQYEFDLANLELRHAFDWATLISQTSRLSKSGDLDVDSSNASRRAGELGVESLRNEGHPRIRSYTQELRLASPEGGRWRWIGGIFLQDYKARLELDGYVANTAQLGPVLSLLPGVAGLAARQGICVACIRVDPLVATEQAAFGELTRKFGERWEVTAGARLYRTRIDADGELRGAEILALYHQPQVTNPLHQSDRGFNPKLSISFKATPDILAYAVVARGFQFGGVNLKPPVNPTDTVPHEYKSSTLWSYEAGVRTDWWQRKLRLDLTAFYLDWTNAQIVQLTPGEPQTDYIGNVGAVHSKGIEAAFAWLTPIPGVSLHAAASWIVARTAEPYSSNGSDLPEGTEMPATPRLQTATTLAYNNVFGAWIAGAALVHTHTGKAFSNITHDHEIYGYDGLNLNLSAGRPDIRFAPALTFGITNLLDERGLLGRTGGDSATDLRGLSSFYNRPRAISLRLTAGF